MDRIHNDHDKEVVAMKKWMWVMLVLWVSALPLAQAQEPDRVNLNSATAQELSQLINIGMSRAEAIVAYREQHGPFRSLQELTQVAGIGERTVELNLDRIMID